MIIDNCYTSLELANLLLNHQTYLIRTLRSNRRGYPKEIVNKKKIQKGGNDC